MCKKLLIAAAAVVGALVVINFTRVGSHARLWKRQACTYMQRQVSPEQEIKRLRMELENLAKEDDRHFHKVAVQTVEVKNLQEQVDRMSANLKAGETRIRAMQQALAGEDRFVIYANEKFERGQLKSQLITVAGNFKVDEELFLSKQEQLKLRKESLESNRKKLSELKLVRQKMLTELERLDNALEQERQAQAREVNTLDDAHYRKVRSEMDELRNRIDVVKTKRTLKGEFDSPVRAAEQLKEQEAAIDRYLETRFSDKQ